MTNATELIDRLYKDIAKVVKAQRYQSRCLDPHCVHHSKIFQIRLLLDEMMREEQDGQATGSKELLDRVYNEIAGVIKQQNFKTSYFDPSFVRYSKLAQVSYLLRVLFEDLRDC